MKILFHDVCQDPPVAGQITEFQQFDINDLLCADDTLLVAGNIRLMNAFLNSIERESDYYNMRLNKGKCLTITMNGFSHTFPGRC